MADSIPSLFLAALLALPGAPSSWAQGSPSTPPPQTFHWSAPPALRPLARRMAGQVEKDFAEARAYTGLPPDPRPFEVVWVADRAALTRELGHPVPPWFAAVAVPSQRKLVIATRTAGSEAQLSLTLRHELMHLAMADLGPGAYARTPAWFHEGVAELYAGELYLDRAHVSLPWLAVAGDLPPLSRYRQGFPNETWSAAIGYALGEAFVRRLVRDYGRPALRDVLARIRAGEEFDSALIAVTGLSTVTHEEALHRELAGLGNLFGDLYTRLFLGLAVFMLLSLPLVRSARRRRRQALERRWAELDDRARAGEDPEDSES